MGLVYSGSIVLRLMELMSGGSRLGSSAVKLRCDGYTLQHLSRQVNEKLFNSQKPRNSKDLCWWSQELRDDTLKVRSYICIHHCPASLGVSQTLPSSQKLFSE